MLRRLFIFVLGPAVFGYGLTTLALSLGMRTAGLLCLAAAFYYVIFGLPGLAIVAALGRRKRRDFVEMCGLLSAMFVGGGLWSSLSYGAMYFVVEASGPRRYTIMESASFGFRDAGIQTFWAGVAIGAAMVCVKVFARLKLRGRAHRSRL